MHHVPMYTFNTSAVQMDYSSLPNSPKEVQNLYWLCLQERLILAKSHVESSLEALETVAHEGMHTRWHPGAGQQQELTARTSQICSFCYFQKCKKVQFVRARFYN